MGKIIRLLLASVMVVALFTACSSKSEQAASPSKSASEGEAGPSVEKTKVVFSTGIPDDAWRRALEFFMNTANEKLKEKNIEVVAEYYPSEEEMWKVLPAQIVSGSAPDLIGLNNEGVLEFIINGTFTSLDGLIEEVGYDTSKLDAANVNGWKYEGKQYALPLTTTISALAVNMTMLKNAGIEEAPKTMEDLVKAALAVTDKEKGQYGVGVNLHEFHISQYLHAFGGGWNFGENMNSEGNQEGLQFIVDLFNKHQVAATPAQIGVNGDVDAFASGKVAMTTAGPWYVATLRDKQVDFEWKLVPIPAGTVQKSTLYGWALAMLDSAKNKEAAMEVIAAMLGEESYRYLAEERGDIPAMTSFVPTYEELYPEMKVVLETADTAVAFNYPVSANRFKTDLVTGLESVIFQNRGTVKDLLDKMAEDGYQR
ncbi:ABC transporter substrate-binding protein [Cohnella hongkongensis]|uniref:ABC transporter substrate-binding protein n=1 Tax=Cohnella hongkongensis TaxID=178337 RepID=A0ABV9FJC9_9BACL